MLETKIEELTKAIHTLIQTMQAVQSQPQANVVKVEDKAVEEAPAQESQAETEEYTPETVQALALRASRADKANKDKIREALSALGATLIKDVPKDKLPELANAIKAML